MTSATSRATRPGCWVFVGGCATILGLVASIIAVFQFTTGIHSIPHLLFGLSSDPAAPLLDWDPGRPICSGSPEREGEFKLLEGGMYSFTLGKKVEREADAEAIWRTADKIEGQWADDLGQIDIKDIEEIYLPRMPRAGRFFIKTIDPLAVRGGPVREGHSYSLVMPPKKKCAIFHIRRYEIDAETRNEGLFTTSLDRISGHFKIFDFDTPKKRVPLRTLVAAGLFLALGIVLFHKSRGTHK